VIDELAWDVGISTADAHYGNHPTRCDRAIWMHSDTKTADPVETGRHDYFKLLVFDMVVAKMLSHVSQERVISLMNEMTPAIDEARMAKVVQKFSQCDIAVLLEIPSKLIPGLEDFHVVHSPKMEKALNTIIIARRTKFECPDRIEFTKSSGDLNPRIIGCNLVSRDRTWQAQVIGVHVSGKGYEKEFVATQLEEVIHAGTIMAGDFNTDLRRRGVFEDLTTRPKLAKLLEQAAKLPLNKGTSNKTRSSFQAQVSKIRSPDFTMKDFVFVGEKFEEPIMTGWIDRHRRIPDAECPSDHAYLVTRLCELSEEPEPRSPGGKVQALVSLQRRWHGSLH